MTHPEGRSLQPVRIWLYAVALLVAAMVLVGGATRLTESGLSITEWKPVTGAVPPISEADWQAEFDRYKTIPQYEILNKGMGLEAFKRIYWWEWGHRLLGRLIGVAFLLPFLWFVATRRIRGALLGQCLGLFVLGGLQGAIGWWMVASGLVARTSVSQYRLAIHLTLACAILAALVWVARGLKSGGRPEPAASGGLRFAALLLPLLVLLQIFAGGLVAGLDAGLTFNTWPLIDGHIVPPASSLLAMSPAWANLFENVMTVQFQHRMLAYALLAFALWHAVAARAAGGAFAGRAYGIALLVALQAALGVATLLLVVPIDVALAHQFGALAVLAMSVVHARAAFGRREAQPGLATRALPA